MLRSQKILQRLSKRLFIFFAVTDFICLYGSGWLLYYFCFHDYSLVDQYQRVLMVALVLNLAVFFAFRIYYLSTRVLLGHYLMQLLKAWTVLVLVMMGMAFTLKVGAHYSRLWFLTWMLSYLSLLVLNRYFLFLFFDFMRARGLNQRCVAIIGCSNASRTLIQRLDKALWTGYKVTHVWRAPHQEVMDGNTTFIEATDIPTQLSSFVQKNKVDEIWFVLSLKEIETIRELMTHFRELAIPIRMILNPEEFAFFEYTMSDIGGFPALDLNASPMQGINRLAKAFEDRLLAALILLFISPLLLMIAMSIRASSKGSIFFKQKRLGWDGKIIKIYKFRTMYEHQERNGVVTQATFNDERITPFGRWLRKTSLDELPQFINVLQGRMSIVGPRPHALSHNDEYKNVIHAYMQRHRVKPGITGWAQVNGWRGETDTLQKMEKRVECDLYYINNWSLSFDLKIILLTLFKGFIHQNAY